MKKKLLRLIGLCAVLLCASLLTACISGSVDHVNTTLPRGTDIASVSLCVEGDTLTGILAYDTEAFSFASDIVTAPGATYTVCTDLMGRDTVPSKTVPIGGGDNIYYLLVSNGQSQKLYTVLLRRGERTTVRLDLRDGSAPLSVYATVGLPITNLPSPTLRGFLFAGWYRDAACTQPFDETEPADNGMTLYAGWQIDPDARVSVTYYCKGQVWQTQQVPYGAFVTPPTPPQTEDDPFVGWYTADGHMADFSAPMVDDTEVTAVFASDMVVVYFYTDEGRLYGSTAVPKGMRVPVLPATVNGQAVTWCTADGCAFGENTLVTSDILLYARYEKAYITLNFEGMLIHYNDSGSGLPALDGTTQIYNNSTGAASRPNASIQPHGDLSSNGNIILNIYYRVMEMFKNTHNPMYILNDGDEHGDYFCVILDHDLTDGSQDETYYFDKDGTGPDHKSADANGTVYPGVYYDCAGREHYDVSALCYLQYMDVIEETLKLSFDFYFEAGGIFPISFYMRDSSRTYGKEFNASRLNLATLMPNGDIAIGVDAVGNAGRLSYKDAEGNTIITEQVLGTAKACAWNHIEFTMTRGETGTNYEVTISLNGIDLTPDGPLNLYVGDLTWGNADMFMIFGGGASYAVETLDHDLVYKFDNIKLVGVED